jgi:hypothetical protein
VCGQKRSCDGLSSNWCLTMVARAPTVRCSFIQLFTSISCLIRAIVQSNCTRGWNQREAILVGTTAYCSDLETHKPQPDTAQM